MNATIPAVRMMILLAVLPAANLCGQITIPTISFLNGCPAVAGGPTFTLVVSGSGFNFQSVVRWDGSDRPTFLVNTTQLQATVGGFLIAAAGTHSVTVFNPGTGGGLSNSLTCAVNNAVPTITGLNGCPAVAGGPSFTLAVSGSGFNSQSVVRWDGANQPTTFISASQLNASISASLIATAGTHLVTVFSPAPGGGLSNTAVCPVANPVPILSSLNGCPAVAGGPAFTLIASGGPFIAQSVVQWNGSALPTTFMGANQLGATVAASFIAVAGVFPVTVFTPAPGGGTSGALNCAVNNPVGQANQPGCAVMVINNAVVGVAPGPHSVSNPPGTTFACGFSGEPGQAIVLCAGTLHVQTLVIPGAGQVDIGGPTLDITVVLNGLAPFCWPVPVLDSSGQMAFSISTGSQSPPQPVQINFQALVICAAAPAGFALTTTFAVTFN